MRGTGLPDVPEKKLVGRTRLGQTPYPRRAAIPAPPPASTLPSASLEWRRNRRLLPPRFPLASAQALKTQNARPCLHPWKPGSAAGPGPWESRRAGGANSTSFRGFEQRRANQG